MVEKSTGIQSDPGMMFRTYRWDAKGQLASGINTLTIIFRSPVAYITASQKERKLPTLTNGSMAHLRKAQSDFGWDWGSHLPIRCSSRRFSSIRRQAFAARIETRESGHPNPL